jgi:uncharacterized flavoprotein (TIGR03862 family)
MTDLKTVIVIGGGPAGLMAADQLARQGLRVQLYDAMPSVGRKFLLAGKGGLNLTHSEALPAFVARYGERQQQVAPWLADFGPDAVRQWAAGLGVETFVGTSGRVFPASLKAAPLLRAWLHRLRHYPVPVEFHMRHRWVGWGVGRAAGVPPQQPVTSCPPVLFETPQGQVSAQADAVLLALGGASWPQLGSDGAWVPLLQSRGVLISPLTSANCGFDVRGGWSPFFASRYAGQPFKSVAIRVVKTAGQVDDSAVSKPDPGGFALSRKGEFVATASGVEGSLVYAASSLLREAIQTHGSAHFELDLLPDVSLAQVLREVTHPRGSRSLSSHLKSRLKLDGIKSAVLHECVPKTDFANPEALARAIKGLPIHLSAARPVQEAISTAGGVGFENLQEGLMLKGVPGVFCAGEMLDWEAPTGGYLLTACLASGWRAAQGIVDHLKAQQACA